VRVEHDERGPAVREPVLQRAVVEDVHLQHGTIHKIFISTVIRFFFSFLSIIVRIFDPVSVLGCDL
jgi:hypothetical protein